MKALSVKLPDPLFHDLAKRAETSVVSQSDIVRSALVAYLRQDAKPPSASCAVRASRWIGLFDGPADLAENPKHLDGFGR